MIEGGAHLEITISEELFTHFVFLPDFSQQVLQVLRVTESYIPAQCIHFINSSQTPQRVEFIETFQQI
jgi:hypothetical protein